MEVQIEPSWKKLLSEEFARPYFQELVEFVRSEYTHHTVYPPGKMIFNAFNSCPVEQVKAVIIGQDPYHGPDQANGLCFSVNDGVSIPPSLQNIYKELNTDLDKPIPTSGNLQHWADQGVLLLNATLTVRAGQAGSHQGKGWENFTDAAIAKLNQHRRHIVFLLWGGYARKKGAIIDLERHQVLTAAHPSPLAAYRGFFGCRHFSQTNKYLQANDIQPIDW